MSISAIYSQLLAEKNAGCEIFMGYGISGIGITAGAYILVWNDGFGSAGRLLAFDDTNVASYYVYES